MCTLKLFMCRPGLSQCEIVALKLRWIHCSISPPWLVMHSLQSLWQAKWILVQEMESGCYLKMNKHAGLFASLQWQPQLMSQWRPFFTSAARKVLIISCFEFITRRIVFTHPCWVLEVKPFCCFLRLCFVERFMSVQPCVGNVGYCVYFD